VTKVWLDNTEWGALFKRYHQQGHLAVYEKKIAEEPLSGTV
jgi:hypothetical protein